MIKFNGLNLKDLKITDALASVVNGKKIAVGSEIIWEKSTSPLPSGYTQVKYLQSSGTQYINTNTIPTDTMRIEINYKKDNYEGGSQWIFGQRVRANNNAVGINYYGSQYPNYKWLNFDTNIKSTFSSSDASIVFDIKNKEILFTQNLSTIRKELYDNIINTTYSMFIFAANQNTGVFGNAFVKVYDWKVYDDDVLEQNFIPCLDTNNVPCMYDTVTQQTFYNQGTGTFGYETMGGTVVAPT